jgi:hypothetical protein
VEHHRETDEEIVPKALVMAFLFGAVLMVPWTIYLAYSLPRRDITTHYDVMWVGFNALLVLVLGRVAWLAYHRRSQVEIPAAILATLLIVDAWFDIMTASNSSELTRALVLAAFVEIPTAIVSLSLVWRVEVLTNRRPRFERRSTIPPEAVHPSLYEGAPQPSSVPTMETNDTISPG